MKSMFDEPNKPKFGTAPNFTVYASSDISPCAALGDERNVGLSFSIASVNEVNFQSASTDVMKTM